MATRRTKKHRNPKKVMVRKQGSDKKSNVFEQDELRLMTVDKGMHPQRLLERQGIFYLKDIIEILEIETAWVTRKAKDLIKKGENPWEIMGVRKVWDSWAVRMTVFSKYYYQHLMPKVRKVDPEWNISTLFKQKGLFMMTDVCRLLPFGTCQIRYLAMKNPNAVEEYGVWKDESLNRYVVKMETFGPWITKVWKARYSGYTSPREIARKNREKPTKKAG